MARVAIDVVNLIGSANPAAIAAEASATWTSGASASGYEWDLQPGDLLQVHNEDSVGRNVTLVAVADPQGRVENSAVALASDFATVFGPLKREGWQQLGSTKCFVDADANLVRLRVLRPPAS